MHKGVDTVIDIMLIVFCMVIAITYYKESEITLKNDVASYGTTQDKSTVGGSADAPPRVNPKTTDDIVLTLLVNDKYQPTTKVIEVNGTKLKMTDNFYDNRELYIQTIWNNVLLPVKGHEISSIKYKYDNGGACWWQYVIN